MLKIGLTGGIGSGKSTAADRFQQLGAPVIDADVIAREAVEPGRPAFDAVTAAFGNEVVGDDGQLDRKALRDMVFADPRQKSTLESILHPEIHAEILRRIEHVSYPYCVIVIPLLAESKRNYPLDRILVVDLPEQLQITRTAMRDNAPAQQIEQIIRSQASRQRRLSIADHVIENSGTPEALLKNIDALHQAYLELARHSE